MKKYYYVFKMVLLEKLQYIFNLYSGMISYAILIFIFLNLWKYMYTDTELIAGYTFVQMAWYLAITEIIWFSIRPKLLKTELSDEIRSGKIAYILNKPINYVSYTLSKYFGETTVKVIFYSISGVLISLIIIGPLLTFEMLSIPFIIITFILASLITALVYILIAMTAFWLEDNSPFFWIYEKIILVIGVIFPIEIFPKFLQPIIKFSPIYSTTYAPAKMAVDFSMDSFYEILPIQLIYVVVCSILCYMVYKKGVKKLNVNGG